MGTNDPVRLVVAAISGGVVLALAIPAGLVGGRLAQTWTKDNTAQLLGGLLTVCGSGVVILAMLVGAGLFAYFMRLRSGPYRENDRATPVSAPDGYYRVLPPGQGDNRPFQLLPPTGDTMGRYTMTQRRQNDADWQ